MTDITDIAIIPIENALQVFTMPGMIEPYLEMIKKEVDAFVPDISTKKGRDAIASFAFKIAKCKTAIDAVGKEETDRQKDIPKKIDATRKRVRDMLDAWRDQIRQPLTEWEAAEETRQARIKGLLDELQAVANDHGQRPVLAIAERLDEIRQQEITEAVYNEFLPIAKDLHSKAIAVLEGHHAGALKREAEAAELEKLRAEKAARDRQEAEERAIKEKAEREARIAKEAQEEAERRAKEQLEAAAKREQAAKEQAEAAQRRAEQAEKDAKEKAERELQAKLAAEKEAERKREANKRHCAKVNNEAAAALEHAGLTAEQSKAVITLIAKGMVPHITIRY